MCRRLSILLILFTLSVKGQDLITLSSGHKILAKVLTIDEISNSIIYQESGASLKSVVSLKYVKNVEFSNGRIETFDKQRYSKPVKRCLFDSTRHFVSIDLSALLFEKLFAVSYEYITGRGHIGLRARLTNGGNKSFGRLYRLTTRQAFGADLNFYPFEGNFFPGRGKLFVGPSMEYGSFVYDYQFYHFNGVTPSNDPQYETYRIEKKGHQFNFMAKTGLLWRISKPVNLSFVLGLGYVWFNNEYRNFDSGQRYLYVEPHPYGYRNRFTARFEINLGFKFR